METLHPAIKQLPEIIWKTQPYKIETDEGTRHLCEQQFLKRICMRPPEGMKKGQMYNRNTIKKSNSFCQLYTC